MNGLIDPGAPEALGQALKARGWLPDAATVTGVARAGEGNMNRVLRVAWTEPDGGEQTAIAKQSSPVVEKFPDIPAPPDRILVEADFYRLTGDVPTLAAAMPDLRAVDEAARLAWLEDLGEATDYADRYGDAALAQVDLDALLDWLSALHGLGVDPTVWPRLANRDMRSLNHAHIFEIPLDPASAPDVDAHCPGLQAAAASLRGDPALRQATLELGRVYLADGPTLLHGDFYPGSWLATARGPRIIDPEFGFLGRAEFDVGVLRAHLAFIGAEDLSLSAYTAPVGFDEALARGFTGAELVRRLLGVAQLPLEAGLAQRVDWLEQGRAAVLDTAG
jgi:5-methylthioribose kinase